MNATKTRIMLVLPALLVLVLAGCTTFKFSGAAVAPQLPPYTKVGTFHTRVTVNKFLGTPGGATLFNITSDATDTAIYDAIQRQIQMNSADAAIGVSIKYEATLVDYLLNSITAGIYAPAVAEVSGTLVKYNK